MSDFQLEAIKEILGACPEYAPNHHMGQPFMSAYQIAIRFANLYPNHPAVPIGGSGSGEFQSLTQRIARFLSGVIKAEQDPGIEGGFLSHEHLIEMTFIDVEDNRISVSTLKSEAAHSIFRLVR